jgi:CopA family copper-resistance protein
MQINRRRFVEGLAVTSGAAAIGFPLRALAGSARSPQQTLHGDRIDLDIHPTAINITGRWRTATAVNGSVPAPILRLREGNTVTLNVTNRLRETSSIHWHGILLPNPMDGVPGLTFASIAPGETFTYRFPIKQAGTYWYHSHSGMQEQTGLYGPLILEPREKEPYIYDREYIVMLSDWTDEDPMTIVSNLKEQSDYYNFQQRTPADFFADVQKAGFIPAVKERLMWARMRMSPTDIMDVTGATYTFLINGQPPAANWTAVFKPGERIRLRFINGSSMTTFDVRIPGLTMTVVAADGSNIDPVAVDEFRIGVAETYDVIVMPREEAHTIFAQAEDRSGYARATLATRPGLTAPIPPMDPRPLRTMADMGMAMSGMSGMEGMDMSAMHGDHATGSMGDSGMPGMEMQGMHGGGMSNMPGMTGMNMASAPIPTVNADGVDPKTLAGQPEVDNVAMDPKNRLAEAGDGLDGNGRRNLTYADLRSLSANTDTRPPTRAIVFHLTGNMERWVWGFDGKKFSESAPVRVRLGERVRFILINDTMMEHPIHLHGFLFQVENGQGDHLPYKHTINVKPGGKMSFVFTADVPGHWAFHCHLLYHMETGMFRTVLVA